MWLLWSPSFYRPRSDRTPWYCRWCRRELGRGHESGCPVAVIW